MPGRILRLPGGVAMNIAMALRRFGLPVDLLTAVGRDAEGDELIAAARARGIGTEHVYRSVDLPTDRYMAVEGANGLIAAIADAHSLEAAGSKILRPLTDGRIASPKAPHPGLIVLDGNLTLALLEEIATSPLFARADLRIAPASPGKATRLAPFLGQGTATIYLNREEAELILHRKFDGAEDAARALVARGATRVIVTDGGKAAADANLSRVLTRVPPQVMVTRVTGAGDVFMAAHIAAEAAGTPTQNAFAEAQQAAADYISGDTPL